MEIDNSPTQSDWDELNELLSEMPINEAAYPDEDLAEEDHWINKPSEEDFRANSIEPKEKSSKPPFAMNSRSAADLLGMILPPTKWIVYKILPSGLCILVAPPKVGKSWQGLDLALSVPAGKPFLGYSTFSCGVLYLALEDSWQRLQNRVKKILQGDSVPQSCYLATQAPSLSDGLISSLEGHLKEHPDTGLIIIDTLQKIRGIALKNEGTYASDYRELATLKKFADDHGICVLVIHHTRKQRDDSDPFNNISGTTGIMGVADTIWMISKENRTDDEATLSITGRDVIQDELTIRFNKESYKWEALGRTEDIAMEREKETYEANPVVKTIRQLVNQNPYKHWRGTMKDLLMEIQIIAHTQLDINERKLTSLLDQLDYQLIHYDGIYHSKEERASGGAPHNFYIPVTTEEDPQLTIEQV